MRRAAGAAMAYTVGRSVPPLLHYAPASVTDVAAAASPRAQAAFGSFTYEYVHITHHTFISFSDPFNLYCVCESGSEGPSIAVSESRDGTYIFALLPYILQRSLIAAGCDR